MTIPVKFNFNNSEIIISEIKLSRKGVLMTIFLICICCGIVDYFLRKQGFVFDWFGNLYLCIGFISFTCWAIKVFNRVADKVDAKEIKKKERMERINFFDLCNEKERDFLFRFYEEFKKSIKLNKKELSIVETFKLHPEKVIIIDCENQDAVISDQDFCKLIEYFDYCFKDFEWKIKTRSEEQQKLLYGFYEQKKIKLKQEDFNLTNREKEDLRIMFLKDLWFENNNFRISKILFYYLNEHFKNR